MFLNKEPITLSVGLDVALLTNYISRYWIPYNASIKSFGKVIEITPYYVRILWDGELGAQFYSHKQIQHWKSNIVAYHKTDRVYVQMIT